MHARALIAGLICSTLAACAGAEEEMVMIEPAGVMVLPEFVTLRDGVVLPEFEQINTGGATHGFALVRGGGNWAYPQADGSTLYADLVLVSGATDKLAAVDTYLSQCYPDQARDLAWGDEYIPRLDADGSWFFEYPWGCPARGSVSLQD